MPPNVTAIPAAGFSAASKDQALWMIDKPAVFVGFLVDANVVLSILLSRQKLIAKSVLPLTLLVWALLRDGQTVSV